MKREFSLKGTLMHRDTPLAEFEIVQGQPVRFTLLSNDISLFPFEMGLHQNGSTLINALLERVVPESRQGLLEELRIIGIETYDIAAILTHQNASSVEDANWVRFPTGPQTWEQLLHKLGYVTTGAESTSTMHAHWKEAGTGDYICSQCQELVSEKATVCPNCHAVTD